MTARDLTAVWEDVGAMQQETLLICSAACSPAALFLPMFVFIFQ